MESLTRFRAVALTVPFALALWLLMFFAAGYGRGIYVPFVVFYAPLLVVSSIGWLTFFVAPALHLVYAAVADVVRAGVLSTRYLLALGLAHYAAVAYVGLATADGRDALFDAEPVRWRAAGAWVALGLALFIVWQVALLLPDGLGWTAVFFGALRIGAVAVPLNTRLGAADWAAMLADSAARVLVTDPALLADLAPRLGDLPCLAHVIVAGGGAATGLEALQARASDALPAEAVDGDAMAFWLYTSGTTGGPKAAIHRHRDLLACRHYGIDVLGATEEDRTFATSKL